MLPEYLVELVRARLGEAQVFAERDLEVFLKWLHANSGRKPVVVVGAGFSRNARYTDGGSADDLPLWGDIASRLGQELFGIDRLVEALAYEPIRLAQLYDDEQGKNALERALRGLVDDSRLRPAEAHLTLFDYPLKAVVTTNQLDTLLDHNRRWVRIAEDPDLARYKAAHQSGELIYFHGHRDNTNTWVLTKNQYEDISKSRPLMLTRVRQLLTQHPVLILGYSLADPDFHQIYRQMSLDMALSQPLGMAVLLSEPHSAERKHWEKLGLRMVVVRDGRTCSWQERNQKFAALLSVGPTYDAPLGNTLDVLRAIERQDTVGLRLRVLREFLNDEVRSTCVESTSGTSEHDLWVAVVRGSFGSEEWENISKWPPRPTQIRPEELTSDAAKSPSVPDSVDSQPALRFLPKERFNGTSFHARLVDALLDKTTPSSGEVADWLEVGLDIEANENDFVGDNRPGIANLASWVWTRATKRINSDDAAGIARKAKLVVTRCFQEAARFRDPDAMNGIKSDAESLSMGESLSVPDGRMHNPVTPFERRMASASALVRDRKRREAFIGYKKAADLARQTNDLLGEWLAVKAALLCIDDIGRSSAPTSDLDLKALDERRLQLETTNRITRWRANAERRETAILKKVIETYQEEESKRRAGVEKWSWDNTVHYYWRTFRDLETRHAHPAQLSPYVDNLLKARAFNLQEELAYRISFQIRETDRWVREVGDRTTSGDLEERAEEDNSLCELLFSAKGTSSGWSERLEAAQGISSLLQRRNVDGLAGLLDTIRKQRSSGSGTHGNASADTSRSFPYVWSVWARFEEEAKVLESLEGYIQSTMPWFEFDSLLRVLPGLPWRRWSRQEHEAIAQGLRITEVAMRRLEARPQVTTEHEHALWTAASLLKTGSHDLPDKADLTTLDGFAQSCLDKSDTGWAHALRAAIWVKWLLTSPDKKEGLFESVLPLIETRLEKTIEKWGDDGLQLGAAVAADLAEEGFESQSFSGFIAALWDRFLQNKERLLAYIHANPHHAMEFGRLLAVVIQRNLAPTSEDPQRTALNIALAAPSVLPEFACTYSPEAWHGRQGKLLQVLDMFAYEDNPETALTRRIAALRFGHRLVGTSGWSCQNVRDLVVRHVCRAVRSSNCLVANHAAFALVKAAKHIDANEDRPVIRDALLLVAKDGRPSVRMAMGYGAPVLGRTAQCPAIVEAASSVDEGMRDDPYAVVHEQYLTGLAEVGHLAEQVQEYQLPSQQSED